MINIVMYYIIAIILFAFICYIIKMVNSPNPIGTYIIKIKDGEILDTARSKAMANILLRQHTTFQRRDDIIIEKVKQAEWEKKNA